MNFIFFIGKKSSSLGVSDFSSDLSSNSIDHPVLESLAVLVSIFITLAEFKTKQNGKHSMLYFISGNKIFLFLLQHYF